MNPFRNLDLEYAAFWIFTAPVALVMWVAAIKLAIHVLQWGA